MRVIYTAFFFLLIIAIIAIAKLSPSVIVNLTIPNTPNVFQMSLDFYTGFIVLLTGIVSVIYFKNNCSDKLSQNDSYKRQCEKITVQNESYQSKVEALEAKVSTLEEALKKALDGNS